MNRSVNRIINNMGFKNLFNRLINGNDSSRANAVKEIFDESTGNVNYVDINITVRVAKEGNRNFIKYFISGHEVAEEKVFSLIMQCAKDIGENRRRVNLTYEIDENSKEYVNVVNACIPLRSCVKIYDGNIGPEYQLSNDNPKPKFIMINGPHFSLNSKKSSYIFLPNCILYYNDQIYIYKYNEIFSTFQETTISNKKIDPKMEFNVKYKYQNKDGSKDERYKDNPEIITYIYSHLYFVNIERLRNAPALYIIGSNWKAFFNAEIAIHDAHFYVY